MCAHINNSIELRVVADTVQVCMLVMVQAFFVEY